MTKSIVFMLGDQAAMGGLNDAASWVGTLALQRMNITAGSGSQGVHTDLCPILDKDSALNFSAILRNALVNPREEIAMLAALPKDDQAMIDAAVLTAMGVEGRLQIAVKRMTSYDELLR